MKRLIAAVLLALSPLAAHAQTLADDIAPSRTIVVPKDKSAAFRLTAPASEIVVSQPDIAQIVANTDRSVYIRGVAMGATNVLVYDKAHRLTEVIDVKVGHDTAALQNDLRAALPGEKIIVTSLGGGVLLSGEATTTAAALRAKAIAERYAPTLVSSSMTILSAQQVMLEVRIVEADRSALKDFGVDIDVLGAKIGLLTGTGLYGQSTPQGVLGISTQVGPTSVDVTLRALEDKGLIRTLARPNLAAVSGEEASFLAGGEFPFPVPRGLDEIVIEFKPFGVQLKFTPTVQDSGIIRLKVAPEVSALDNTNPLRLNGVEVPSLTIRRAATTIELQNGESFAMAGLFQQEYANNVRQIPGISEVPVLGALFRSARWRRRETELLILVTPRLVTAEESRILSPNPVMSALEPTSIELILAGQNADRPFVTPVGAAPGPTP